MKNIFFTFLSLLFAVSVSAQLTNNGATIIIEAGATLFVETDIVNTTGGTITNDGIIEVQGDLTNAGTMTNNTGSKVIFSGTAGSEVTSGGAVFTTVELNKTAEDVTLLDEMTVSTDLNFVGNNNKVVLGANDLVLTSAAIITSPDDNEYIVADAAGVVTKEMDAVTSFDYPIGTSDDKYTPLTANVTAATFPLSLDVNTSSMKQPDVPVDATDFINRFWNVDAGDDTGLAATLTGTYDAADLETGATAADVKGAHYESVAGEWTYSGAAAGTNQVIGDIAKSGDFTGTNSFGKVGLTVFLQGAYSGGTMSTALGSAGLIPLTSPYDATVTVTSIPADVTDWIEVEIRDAGSAGTILSTHSAFLRNDGVILGLDGNPNPLLLNAPGSGFVGVNHRNHLSVNTATALNLSSTGFDNHDFSTGLDQAYDNPAIINNDAMIDLGSGVFGLFRGDANSNNGINVIDAAITRNGSSPIQSNVYSNLDVNMNGGVNVIDAAITKLSASPIKSAHVQ